MKICYLYYTKLHSAFNCELLQCLFAFTQLRTRKKGFCDGDTYPNYSISLYTIFLRPYIFIFTFLNCVIVNSGKLFHGVRLLSHK